MNLVIVDDEGVLHTCTLDVDKYDLSKTVATSSIISDIAQTLYIITKGNKEN